MSLPREQRKCPVCGDGVEFMLWQDDSPPPGCAHDPTWPECTQIKTVTECSYQMGKARQRAEWIKAAPEEFDASGNMHPGRLAYVLEKWHAAFPESAERGLIL